MFIGVPIEHGCFGHNIDCIQTCTKAVNLKRKVEENIGVLERNFVMQQHFRPCGKQTFPIYSFSLLLLLVTLCHICLLNSITRMLGCDLSGIDLPRVVEHPINKKNSREEPFLQQLVQNLSTTLNCGCPRMCRHTALSKKAPGLTFTCQDHINYLMKRHHQTQKESCFAAANKGIQSCGSECNPNVC